MNAQSSLKDSIYWWLDSTSNQSEINQKQYFEKAFSLAKTNKFIKEEAISLYKLSIWAKRQGDYPKALAYIEQAEKRVNRIEMPELVYNNLLQRGSIYMQAQQFVEAEKLFKESLNWEYVQSNIEHVAILQNNLGNIAYKLNQYEEALNYFENAVFTFKQLNKQDRISVLENNMAVIYLNSKAYDKAIAIFKKYLKLNRTKQNKIEITKALGNLGYTYGLLEEYPKALAYYQQSIAIAKKEGYNEALSITYYDLAEMYQVKKDYTNAFHTFKAYHKLKVKLAGEATQKRVSELTIKYKQEKQQKELFEKENQLNLLQKENTIRQQRFWLLLVATMGLVIGGIIYYRKQRIEIKQAKAAKILQEKLLNRELQLKEKEKENLQTKLELKNKDLTNLSLDILRKNEFSLQYQAFLKDLEDELPPNLRDKIKELKMQTDTHLRINEDLNVLQVNVEKVNQEFYKKLDELTKFTPSEKQICGLIRLNLSNKEIALIRNTTEGSAKVFRYRIRKKLGLQSKEDIVAFLQNI